MPFIFIGALASVVGWFLFLSGLGLESNALTRTLVSVHFGSLASNIINFGYFLMLVGLVQRLRKYLTQGLSEFDEQGEISVEDHREKERLLLEQAFKSTFNKSAIIRPDRSVRIFTEECVLDFQSAEAAWEYCTDHFYLQTAH